MHRPPARPDSLDGSDDTRERLCFEAFLSDLAARLLSVPPEEVDTAIQQSLADLAVVVGSDRGGVALFSEDGRALMAVHAFARPGITHARFGTDLTLGAPWWAEQLRKGAKLVFPDLPDGLPAEAQGELSIIAAIGTKSHLALPLKAGDEVLGAFIMEHMREWHSWSPQFLARLDVLASVYANALYRRRADLRLRRANALNKSILASVASEIVVLDREGRIVSANEAWTRSARRAAGSRAPLGPGDDYIAACEQALSEGLMDRPECVDGLRGVLAGEVPQYEGTYSYGPGSQPRRHYLATINPLATDSGVVVVHTDVTDLERAKADLARSLEELRELKAVLEEENVLLYQQVRRSQGFDEIVGTSPALARVLAQVEQVATADAPVLILGETGTGKELVARAIHDHSRRHARPLITVNCAALPATLIESELFGYEKGAFTGAVQRTVGRFEVAHGGSLLLDEVGELPLEAQAKLLRVLEGGEFQRLGSPKTTKVDVRVIAATNRDLEGEVRAGRFRPDLFYRLSVFPISLPPLRERREDIPLLVWHCITRRQVALGKRIRRVPERLMDAFMAHPWPGNVRELENVLERALIMTTGSTLAIDPSFVGEVSQAPTAASAAQYEHASPRSASLADAQRAHIRAVLDECQWRIAGPGNAADRLGLPRSTLLYRIRKLGIERP